MLDIYNNQMYLNKVLPWFRFYHFRKKSNSSQPTIKKKTARITLPEIQVFV